MGLKSRWLAFLLPVLFLGVLLGYAFHRDPHFWRSPTSLYRSAQDAEKRGEIPLALKMAQKSFARDPQNSGCGTLLGWLHLRGGEPQKALEVLTQVWERDQKATAALKGRAQALDLLGRRPEALELLSKYLAGQPEDADISLFAAQLAGSRQDDWELAVKYYQQYCRLRPDPAARRHLVDLLAALNRFQEAIPYQEEEAAQRPDDQEALHRLALFHYWQRDYEAASELYRRLLERAQEDALLRNEAAQAADAAKKVDEALKHYLWLYARHQGKREHALKLARLWSQKGNHAEAVAVLAPLVKEHLDPETQRWLALESLLTGDLDRARQAYRAAWEAGDTHQETIINLARLYARQRQFSRAAAMWDEAERRQLVRAELRWEAALTYSYAQRFADAVSILEPVRRDNPKYPRLQLFLGQMHFYQKHWGQAAHYFKAYLEQHPDDPEAGRLLAEALAFKAETRDEAIAAYGELLKRRNDVHLRLRRVALLLEEERWEEAESELKACPPAQEPKLLREQARLCLWAGNLEDALARYEDYLKREPRDGEARLERARVLTYLGRAAEAMEFLKTLPGTAEPAPGQPGRRAVLAAGIEAALAHKDRQQALALALKLYGCQFTGKARPPRDWQEARRRAGGGWQGVNLEESGGWLRLVSARSAENREDLQDLALEERTWVARALCHAEDPGLSILAVDLAVENLREDRHHHATLLILAHLLPRLPSYEDLSRLVYRIPGIRPDSPEYVAALAYFDGNLGRHGGKLDYLLHVLKNYRHQRPPRNPGELLALANLAAELDDRQAAAEYYRLAQQAKPNDRRLAGLLLDGQVSQKDWGKALASLEGGGNPRNSLEKARLYMVRGQYEGVKATVAQIPAGHPDQPQALLLLAQAYRLERNYPEALKILEQLQGHLPTETLAMARAQVLESQGDKRAAALYEEVIRQQPGTQASRVAAARRARALGNWSGAYDAYAKALEAAPQDVELLNELENVRQQMRPQMASRGFPYPAGERRPEEYSRPWQFSRPDREFVGYLPRFSRIPVLAPETLFFRDSNGLYGGIVRASTSFYLTRALPVSLAVEYRQYQQETRSQEQGPVDLGLSTVYRQAANDKSRLRRLEVALGAGPVNLTDRLKVAGEIIWRGYWKRVDRQIVQTGQEFVPFPVPGFIDKTVSAQFSKNDYRNRLMGSVQVDFPLGASTDVSLKYSRRDIFDQDSFIFPRLFQSVINLGDARLTTLDQVEMRYNHQFRPGLEWRGNVGGAFFSDNNRRLTLYQGLAWQAVNQPRMHLGFTPHYYLAAYQNRRKAYFSPASYNALGLTVDFDRQLFRLPTLILQGTVQAVGQHGDWGPGLQGLAALEWEPVHNFFIDPHVFYFREWVDNYHILTFGLSLRYVF